MAERDFEEFLGLFNKHRVRYCIVGAYASALYARPRYTKDMDILVEPSIANGRKVTAALKEFGFGTLKLTAEDFAKPGRLIQLGYEPIRIDLLTSIDGCTFEQIWKNRVRDRYGDQPASYIGRTEFIQNKKAAARPQDLVDLGMLRPKRTSRRR